jgi:predicted DsbA family dithiol-disulfide isomerase
MKQGKLGMGVTLTLMATLAANTVGCGSLYDRNGTPKEPSTASGRSVDYHPNPHSFVSELPPREEVDLPILEPQPYPEEVFIPILEPVEETPSPSSSPDPTSIPTPTPQPECPITLEWYDNLENKFGALFTQDTLPQVFEQYADYITVDFKHFPLPFQEQSRKAGEAVECATDQGKRLEFIRDVYNRFIFQDVPSVIAPDISREALIDYAGDLQLDTDMFTACLDSGDKAEIIEQDFQEGIRKGVNGIPYFTVTGQVTHERNAPLVGLQPFFAFENAIHRELFYQCGIHVDEENSCPLTLSYNAINWKFQLPDPYCSDQGNFANNSLIVGSTAPARDVIAGIDAAITLQALCMQTENPEVAPSTSTQLSTEVEDLYARDRIIVGTYDSNPIFQGRQTENGEMVFHPQFCSREEFEQVVQGPTIMARSYHLHRMPYASTVLMITGRTSDEVREAGRMFKETMCDLHNLDCQ